MKPDLASTPALILAGGLGTRLRSVIADRPKAMAPIDGRPFLEHLLQSLRRQGIGRVVLLVGYQAQSIESHFGDGGRMGLRIEYCREKELLGTAGALKNAQPLVNAQDLLLLNGDTFFACDLPILLHQHTLSGAPATLALKLMSDTARYGRVSIDPAGRITAFHEKDLCAGEGYINAGVYALNRRVFDRIPAAVRCSLEREIFPFIDAFGIPFPDPFIDIGVPDDYARAATEIPQWDSRRRRAAAFLDRDGIVNDDFGYPHAAGQIVFRDGIFDFCRAASRAGYRLFVASNQAGVARGMFGIDEVRALHEWMGDRFRAQGVPVDGFLFCPYHEKGTVPEYTRPSLYRKPDPGMFLDIAEKAGIDLTRSFMVGDKTSDRIRLPYLRSFVIKSRYTPEGYDFVSLSDLAAALFG